MSDYASAAVRGIDGPIPDGKLVIVASRYNAEICDALVDGAARTLSAAGIAEDRVSVVRIPGAWELPLACRYLLPSEPIGIVALGCVIKGETTHDEHINRGVSLHLMRMSVRTGIPIGFGLLTCNTQEQALARAGGRVGNKGEETASAVLEMLRLKAKLQKV